MHSLTPFIWTPTQPIHVDRYSLRLPPREEGRNRWFLLRRMVELPVKPDRAPAKVTADGRYILYVNGKTVGRGPVRCSPLFQRFDEYDLAPVLTEGENVFAALVHTYGVDTAFYEMPKGAQFNIFGDGGFWMEGEAVAAGKPIAIISDESWRIVQSDAWKKDVPRA